MIEIKCPSCGHSQNFEVHSNLDVSVEPTYKNMVLDFQLFKTHCESCERVIPVQYETLYHDFDQRLMIILDPSNERTDEEINQYLEAEYGPLENYTIRRVFNPDQLKEKVQARDAHIDDRLLEVTKVYYLLNASNQKLDNVADVLFNRGLTEHEIVFLLEEGKVLKTSLNLEIMGHLSQMFGDTIDSLTKPGCNTIDGNWAAEVLKQFRP